MGGRFIVLLCEERWRLVILSGTSGRAAADVRGCYLRPGFAGQGAQPSGSPSFFPEVVQVVFHLWQIPAGFSPRRSTADSRGGRDGAGNPAGPGARLTQGTQLPGCYMGRTGRGLLPKSNSCRPEGMVDSVESSWIFYLCLPTCEWPRSWMVLRVTPVTLRNQGVFVFRGAVSA